MTLPANEFRLNRRTALFGAASLLVPTVSVAQTDEISHHIARLTDEVRRQHGLRPLEQSVRLEHASAAYADTLARHQRLSHTVDGTNIKDRAQRVRYRFRRLGENIGWTSGPPSDFEIARDLVSRWMRSRGHRINILDRNFRELGVGVARANGKTYAVQFFGAKV